MMISSAIEESGLMGSPQKRPIKNEDIEELMKGIYGKQRQEDMVS